MIVGTFTIVFGLWQLIAIWVPRLRPIFNKVQAGPATCLGNAVFLLPLGVLATWRDELPAQSPYVLVPVAILGFVIAAWGLKRDSREPRDVYPTDIALDDLSPSNRLRLHAIESMGYRVAIGKQEGRCWLATAKNEATGKFHVATGSNEDEVIAALVTMVQVEVFE